MSPRKTLRAIAWDVRRWLSANGHPGGVAIFVVYIIITTGVAALPYDLIGKWARCWPSIIDLPAPGCWTLHLSWSGHTDEIQLRYVA
jgi:hypothetical protein